jgi:hypothetical protein
MLQRDIACFDGIHLSFVQLDVFALLFYCGVPLSEAELMISYKCIIFKHFHETF